MSVSVGVVEFRYLDVPKFPVEPFIRELKLGPMSTYGCLKRVFDIYDLGFQSQEELFAAMRPVDMTDRWDPEDEWDDIYEDNDNDWDEFYFDELWGGNWDNNGMYEFPRDSLEKMARLWAFKQKLSEADREGLLDWVSKLPFEDDLIMLHIGE